MAILDAVSLQPLVRIHNCRECISELKYSPPGGPQILAVGCHDLHVYLYTVANGYHLKARCVGHSGTIEHLDWSLPIDTPVQAKGRWILQANDTSREVLHWDPRTGKQMRANQRDASW